MPWASGSNLSKVGAWLMDSDETLLNAAFTESFQFAEIYYWKMNYDRSPIPVVYNRILPMHIVHHKVVKPGPDNETLTSPMEIWYSESAASDSHPPNKAVENLVPNNNKTWYGDLLVLFFAAPDMSTYRDASYSDRHNVSNFIVRRGPPKGVSDEVGLMSFMLIQAGSQQTT